MRALSLLVVVVVPVACGDHAGDAAPAAADAAPPSLDGGAGDASGDRDGSTATTCPIFGSLGATCDECVAAHCCAEYTACFSTPECIDINDCNATCDEAVGGSDAGSADAGDAGDAGDATDCPSGCSARHPEFAARFDAWDHCVATRCTTACTF